MVEINFYGGKFKFFDKNLNYLFFGGKFNFLAKI